jgi:hypothetical protein
MISFYLIICLIGLILLIIFAMMGGFTGDFDVDSGDVDVDIGHIDVGHADVGDVDADVDVDVDHDVDSGGHGGGPSPLSLPILLVFVTSFGAIGMILEVFELLWLYIPIISAIVSIAVAGFMFVVMVKIFSATQSTSVVPLHKLVGMRAMVSVAIRKHSEGQIVVVRPERGRMLIGAIADENISVDSVVQIIEVVGNVVRVKKYDVRKKGKKKQAVMR